MQIWKRFLYKNFGGVSKIMLALNKYLKRSLQTRALLEIFCTLNGVTRIPARCKIFAITKVRVDFPALLEAPKIEICLILICLSIKSGRQAKLATA